MQFKVGDRVEVLKPADGLIGGRANNLGLGIVEDVDAFQVRVKVEANDQAWWYDIESVRPLTPATTLEKPYPHEDPKPTPTPSITQAEADRMRGDKIREELYGVKYATPTIEADKLKAGTMQRPITVGTQVRLTGVVRRIEEASGEPPYTDWVAVKIDGSWESPVGIAIASVEVIRQPFKRGEVVYFEDHDITCVVLEDEQNGRMLLIEAGEGKYATYVDADLYERRP